MKHARIPFILASLAILAPVAHAIAQPGPPAERPNDRGPGAERPKQRPGAGRPERAERFREMRGRLLRERVGLSDAKAAEVEAIVRRSAEERRKARAELTEARRELSRLFAQDSQDQAAWAAALAKLKSARDAMETLRDREYAELGKALTPKEQATLLRAMQRVQRHVRRGGDRGGKNRRGPGKARPHDRDSLENPFSDPPKSPGKGPAQKKGPPPKKGGAKNDLEF